MSNVSASTGAVAEVAVAGVRPGGSPYLSYEVPPPLRGTVAIGQVVWVPLRGKPALGVVARLHDEPTSFPLNGVIPCWTEGVQRMKAGGKAKLTCPPSIAYGARGAGGVIPPNATLNFEIELISIGR